MIRRRHLLTGLAATLAAACGTDPRRLVEPEPVAPPPPAPEPCPTCGPKDRPEPPVAEPPAPPYLGIEYLAQLSYRPSDPAEAVRVLAEHGIQVYRTFTVLARWGHGPQPPPGWFVHPLDHEREFFDRLHAFDDACKRHGVIGHVCAFDDPQRWNPVREPEVARALELEVIDPASASTWLDADDSTWEEAEGLLRFYFDELRPSPWLWLGDANEPGDWPSRYQRPPTDRIARWMKERGFTVVRNTRIGDDGPYLPGDVVEEHAFGRPGVAQPWPPWGRLDALRRAHPGTHVLLSTDGFGIEDHPDAASVAGEVLQRGFSFSGLVRTAPDLWTAADRRAVDRMVESARRASRAA